MFQFVPGRRTKFSRSFVSVVVLFAVGFTAGRLAAQTVAFPGALGYGAYATGGRNGTVYHVTTLADSGAGSFRTGVGSGNRTIVFDVGGNIKLLTAVTAKDNLTIAGQTAPGGVSFDGGEISFAGRANIICRFIRIRPGSDTASTGDDCLSLYNAHNTIFDHISMEYGPWNNLDAVSANWQTTPVTDITFQHCIDANPTGQQFGAHTECPSANWTWCYNIFANSHNRNPLAKVNTVFVNNIEYNNSAGYTTHTSTSFKHDIVNNYFVAGPASSGNFPWYQIDNNQSMYFTGNLYDSAKDGTLSGSTTKPLPGYQGGGTILSAPWSSWTSIIPTLSAPLAWRYGLSTAGAFPRDEVDSLVIGQMKTLGTGGPGGGLYTTQAGSGPSNNGYGTIVGLTPPTDTDNDGMPDFWELATGSSTNVANPLTNTVSGYTLLENYLNFLAAPHGVTRSNTPVTINLRQFVGGFAAGSTFTLGGAVNGTVALSNGTNAVFTPTANFVGLGSFSFTNTEGSYAISAVVTVCVSPISVTNTGTTAFNGALVGASAAAATIPLPANLTWRGDGAGQAWNTTSSNWLNGASLAKFKDNDVVTFDDTGSNTPNISLSGTLTPGAMLFDIDKNYTLAGTGSFGGSGSFNKTGSGTLTISTLNSGFTGPISIGGGTVNLNTNTSIGSGDITLSAGATLTLPNPAIGTIAGNIIVPAGDSGTISSSHVSNGGYGNLISGDTNSVLNFVGNQSLGGSSSSQFSQFNGTIHIVSGNVRFSTPSGNNTFGSLTPNFIIDGTLQPRNSSNTIVLGALNGSGSLAGPQTAPAGAGTTVYNVGGKNQDAIFTGTIVSNANSAGTLICFNKVGTGTQILNGNNTFGGTNGILGGTLILNGTNIPSLCTVFSGATLGGTGVITGPVSVKAGGLLSPGEAGSGNIGTLTINNQLTTATPTLNFDLSSLPAGANDRINMTGTLAMSGVQTYNFNLVNNALGAGTYGLIEGANNSSQSSVSFVNNLPLNTRQTISLTSAAPGSNPSYIRLIVTGTPNSLTWRGTNGNAWDISTVNWANGASADKFYNLDAIMFSDLSTNGKVTLAGTLQPASIWVNNDSLAYTFGGAGALTGSGTFTKSGTGNLTINTTNNLFTGNIAQSGGTLTMGGGASLGSGTMSLSSGAVLSLPNGIGTNTNAVAISRSITIPASQTATITSGVLASTLGGAFISGNSSSTLNLSGAVSFTGTTSSQLDNFNGTVNLQPGGTLRFANGSSNIYGSFNTVFILNGTLQPRDAGNTIQLGTFSGSGTIAGPQTNSGTGDTTYVLGGNDTSATFSGVISSNTAVAGSDVILNKIGNGTLTLSGASTYAGGTTVSAGTLLANNLTGSATGSGDMEVFAGATLAGNGFIGSATTIDNGATLAPGNPTGTLTFSNSLTLNDSSVLQFSLGTSSDSVLVKGSLFLTGQLNITNAPGFGVGTYTLFTCTGTLTFDNLVLTSAPAGYNYRFDTSTPGVVKLVVTLPVIGSSSISGGKFIFSGSGGATNGVYYVVASTNLAAPAASWIRTQTNHFDANGNFSVTNGPATNAQSFYRLQLQ
jgi:autotransporter-associated beta strand protein